MFLSTRGYKNPNNTFLDTVRMGLSPDGGLFVPLSFPKFTNTEIEELPQQSYSQRAFSVLSKFSLGIEKNELQKMIISAYSSFHHEDIAPIVPITENTSLLELYWGPTASFKDMALQLTPHFFGKSKQTKDQKFCIVTATSGDTGIAAIEGFRKIPGLSVMVLYPNNGVSQVQKLQMQSVEAKNVQVVGVDGDFDFCQSTVKKLFNDPKVKTNIQDKHNTSLSAANSMNWGRLLPQVVYYFSAYADLLKNKTINAGEEIEICVPSGNFGNVLGAYMAKKMGLPISKFIIAANQNNVLAEFFQTGIYDISTKKLEKTDSPSIDILKSSNIERFLYFISNGDTKFVAKCFEELETKQKFELPENLKQEMKQYFTGSWATEKQMQETIVQTYEKTSLLLDPHTAVAVFVSNTIPHKTHRIITATAHYQKFAPAMVKAFSEDGNNENDIKKLFTDLKNKNSKTPVHVDIENIIEKKPVQNKTCSASYEEIVMVLEKFITVQ